MDKGTDDFKINDCEYYDGRFCMLSVPENPIAICGGYCGFCRYYLPKIKGEEANEEIDD